MVSVVPRSRRAETICSAAVEDKCFRQLKANTTLRRFASLNVLRSLDRVTLRAVTTKGQALSPNGVASLEFKFHGSGDTMPTFFAKSLRGIEINGPTVNVPAPTRSVKLGQRVTQFIDKWRERLAQIAFALFVGSLVALLAVLYAGVPII
jgi:hypothetical protein